MNLDIYFEFVTRKGTSFVWETSDHGWAFTVTILSLGRPTGVLKNTTIERKNTKTAAFTQTIHVVVLKLDLAYVASGSLF